MTTYLHQVVAVQRGVEAEAKARLEEVQRILGVGGDQNPLTGLDRTHTPKTDQDQQPDQRRLVQLTTAGLVARYADAAARLFDVQYTREAGNTRASADVVVDGETFLAAVPAGYLLFIEGQLTALLSGLVARLQALDPAQDWHQDENDPAGVYRSAPRETLSTTRRLIATPAWPPRPDIPAPPVEWRDTDVVTGRWTWVNYSGQLPARRIQEVRDRASRLLSAVRAAREQANRLEVEDRRAGREILGYVFGDLLG